MSSMEDSEYVIYGKDSELKVLKVSRNGNKYHTSKVRQSFEIGVNTNLALPSKPT